jgi:hypothetical protein
MCIEKGAVTRNGDVRASPLYTGGPNGVTRMEFIFISNCKTGVSTLQDRQGVNFAGNFSSATPAAASLSRWMCEFKSPKTNPKLRQF